ncbi:unnamed protein product [Phaeothamnion confervicola]
MKPSVCSVVLSMLPIAAALLPVSFPGVHLLVAASGATSAPKRKHGLACCIGDDFTHYRPIEREAAPDLRVARLHLSARKAIKRGRPVWARSFYELVMYHWNERPCDCALAQSYLLLGLLEQKEKRPHNARAAFREGCARCPRCARLYQAWALFESKQGNLRRARQLIERAVRLDASLKDVLRWRIFAAASDAADAAEAAAAGTTGRPLARERPQPAT